jgi:hypothetical protein
MGRVAKRMNTMPFDEGGGVPFLYFDMYTDAQSQST